MKFKDKRIRINLFINFFFNILFYEGFSIWLFWCMQYIEEVM